MFSKDREEEILKTNVKNLTLSQLKEFLPKVTALTNTYANVAHEYMDIDSFWVKYNIAMHKMQEVYDALRAKNEQQKMLESEKPLDQHIESIVKGLSNTRMAPNTALTILQTSLNDLEEHNMELLKIINVTYDDFDAAPYYKQMQANSNQIEIILAKINKILAPPAPLGHAPRQEEEDDGQDMYGNPHKSSWCF